MTLHHFECASLSVLSFGFCIRCPPFDAHFSFIHNPQYLRLGYWPSFNVPFFEQIWNVLGYRTMCTSVLSQVLFACRFVVSGKLTGKILCEIDNKFGNEFSYSMCPRASIFRRDAHSVLSLTLQHLMLVRLQSVCPHRCFVCFFVIARVCACVCLHLSVRVHVLFS